MPVIASEEVQVMKPPKGDEAGELPDHDAQIAASNEDEVFALTLFCSELSWEFKSMNLCAIEAGH